VWVKLYGKTLNPQILEGSMDLFEKAFKVLQTDTFSRKRYLAAIKLYRQAKGEEKKSIGELFESQMVLIKNNEDLDWIAKVAPLFESKG